MQRLNNSLLKQIFIILLFLGCVIQNSNGQTVTMPNIIGSNMVLQQNTQVPLWGWATAGTSVVISASWGQSSTVVTPASGKWMTRIKTPVAVPALEDAPPIADILLLVSWPLTLPKTRPSTVPVAAAGV